MKIPLIRSANYHKNFRANDSDTCAVCGKVVTEPRFWIRVVDGGDRAADREEVVAASGDCGEYPVGETCRRRAKLQGITFER